MRCVVVIIHLTTIFTYRIELRETKHERVVRRRIKRELLYVLWKNGLLLRTATHCGKNFANRAIPTTKGLRRAFLQENKYLSFSKL